MTRNPIIITSQGGSSSAVERQLPKLDAEGSIPFSRSILFSDFHHRQETWVSARLALEVTHAENAARSHIAEIW